MSRHLAELDTPLTAGLPRHVRDLIAEDLTIIAIAMREQANLLRAAGMPGLETAIVTLTHFAEAVARRAHAYRHQ